MKNNSLVQLKYAGDNFVAGRTSGLVSEIADRIRRSIVYMGEHLDKPLQISALAAQANVSTSHYFSIFKREIGSPPMGFFIRLRMDHARQLLDSTSSSIKEIAALVGYNDQFYFSRVFKSVHRMAPTEYRRRNGKPAVGEPQSNGRTVKPLSIFKMGVVGHEDRALSPNHLSQNNHR